MPKDPYIKKVLVIGSGPIVIGQAAEFDYAGTQACRALKQAGLEVVLINSNPATIMTDNAMADKIYIEPLTIETVRRVILKEQPDSLLSTLGGQTGLTLSMQLEKEGFLKKHGVRLLGARVETIDRAEDRLMFKETMEKIGQPVVPSVVAEDLDTAFAFAGEVGYPLIIRPAFTLGGTGGGMAGNKEELREVAGNGLRLSPIGQILVERNISGWKEIEFEVMRDKADNVITICSMENVDPVGIHTGDSIVVAPAMTLSDKEYQMLRSAAIDIIRALEVEGGCNCQFALHPESFEYAVIEVNPRVSRSSALASKATGYPIAKVAAQMAIGYRLDEIKNDITGTTYAAFEPALDYIVVKFPKWPFDKFVYANRKLGTQMKATGEVMSIGTTFEQALMKAVRGAEISMDTLNHPHFAEMDTGTLLEKIGRQDDERIFAVYEALRRGVSAQEVYEITMIDHWFLGKLLNLIAMERALAAGDISEELYMHAKHMGFTDAAIGRISGQPLPYRAQASYKMVDTCAAEFAAETPYFYATYDDENEAKAFIEQRASDKKTIIVFGSGPIRIGQGIEFDYASVHCVWALKDAGYDVVIVNNNPETVSTDFDTGDRLYFEPLTPEDVMNIIHTEKPYACVVAFGGQTAIKLTRFLSNQGIRILGTSADSIDMAEDRERFDALLEKLNIKRPAGLTVMNKQAALEAANKLGYPVLLRPSYVLGGQNMIIAHDDNDVREYMDIILEQNIENPVLIDQYLKGLELELDAICDGENILIPGIMQHVERAGIHSGDSIAVYPAHNIRDEMIGRIIDCSRRLAVSLDTRGLVNIQYLIFKDELYVIEVNPRSSRTIPYISKVTGVPMVDLAVRAMLGEKLTDMGYGTGLYPSSPYVAVKVPVFSSEKLADVDTHLGPEMQSTGEVLGLANTLEEALYKGLVAAGYKIRHKGGVLLSVRHEDRPEVIDIAKQFKDMGFTLYATEGNAGVISKAGMQVNVVDKADISENDVLHLLDSDKVQYVVSTSAKGRIPTRDSVRIRRKAAERGIPCMTSMDTAGALLECLRSRYTDHSTELVEINHMRRHKVKLSFIRMHSCGNDYIYFNCFDQQIDNPEGLAVRLCDRHRGIGGDGVVLICPSQAADARMRLFNRDGTEGGIGGVALCCVAKYLYDSGMVKRLNMQIETASGMRAVQLFKYNGQATHARVNMGPARFDPRDVPVNLDGDQVISRPVEIGGKTYEITCLSMGNPHCVVFDDAVETLDVAFIGPQFEHNELFPERVNAEFIHMMVPGVLRMRVWERGNGETLACGTGACVAAVAAVKNGLCEMDTPITVKLNGGDVTVEYTDSAVYLTSDANIICEGTVEL